MEYNFVLIRTTKGKRYASKIGSSIKWLNQHVYKRHKFNFVNLTIEEFMEAYEDGVFKNKYKPNNTIIHPRCANPDAEWINYLAELEKMGYKVTNSTKCIKLTSNKLACSLHLQDKVNHPKTWEYTRGMGEDKFNTIYKDICLKLKFPELIIAKPLTSIEQGANVKKINLGDNTEDDIIEQIEKVPGKRIVLQELVEYTALHRVIVIGGKALPYTFIDKPEWHPNDWKVSCCLNRISMQICQNPSKYLLELAEKTQKEVGGTINFIDIFEYPAGGGGVHFTNAEINTACSLNIHELLAQKAGREDWNIHYRIAKQLVKELLGG